jgi:hypothetical protein
LKRILSILLVIIVLINTVGVSVYFTTQQYFIKKEIKRKIKNAIPNNELIVITANEKDLDWEDEKEFRYHENMYDIVRKTENKDGSTTYYCIDDKDEKTLFANVGKIMDEQNENESTLLKNILKCVWTISSIKEQKSVGLLKENKNDLWYLNSYKNDFFRSINQPPQLG